MWTPAPATPYARNTAEAIAHRMYELGWQSDALEKIIAGVALPLKEALRTCLPVPPDVWPAELYTLIGREDLATQLNGGLPKVVRVRSLHSSSPLSFDIL